MNNEKRVYIRALYPIVCFGAYSLCRYFNQTPTHIGGAGGINVAEQIVLHAFMRWTLDLSDPNLYKNIRFFQVLYAVSIPLTVGFAAIGTTLLHFTAGGDYKKTLVIYSFSHICGNYFGLYLYYVLRNNLRRWPSRSFLVDLCIISCLDVILNAFQDYGVFRYAAIIMAFPLLAFVASRHDQGWSAVADVSITVITFVFVISDRGPFISGRTADLDTIVSLYIMMMCSAALTSLLSLFMEQRRQSMQNVSELKDDMFLMSGQISHDIRAPIAHIMGVCESLTSGTYTEEDLNEVKFSCQTVCDIMDSWLLMLSVLEKNSTMSQANKLFDNNIQVEDLDNLIQRVRVYTERAVRDSEKQITVVLMKPDRSSYGEIQFNSKLLHHVLINLVSNAVKYSESGEIRVAITFVKDQPLLQPQLEVIVSDQGKGIKAKHIPHLFNRFYRVADDSEQDLRSHERSSHHAPEQTASYGVGLSIVQSLVNKMGGTVTVTSVFGTGSMFCVTIPCLFSDKEIVTDDEESVSEAANAILAKIHVLLAEDNKVCSRLYARHLEQCASVRVIEDGALVMDVLRECKYDVLLLDGNLPNKSGQQILIQLFRESGMALVPVVVTISGGLLSTTENWSPLIVLHCPKPFSKAELTAAILKAMRLKTRRSLVIENG